MVDFGSLLGVCSSIKTLSSSWTWVQEQAWAQTELDEVGSSGAATADM